MPDFQKSEPGNPTAPRQAEPVMNEVERDRADVLLSRIEVAVGQLPDRHGPNAVLIAEMLQAVNGLRSLLGVVRSH
jgi:hypothetical protein